MKSDAELMTEVHWCPWHEDSPGVRPTRIDREGLPGVALIVPCAQHGEQAHDSHDDDCWCVK